MRKQFVQKMPMVRQKVGGSWTPLDLPGIKMFLYAPDIEGLSNDDAVASWADMNNAITVSQATAGKRPLYKTSVLNGLPVVRFDGTDDELITTTLGMTTGNMFFVVRFDLSNDRRLWCQPTSYSAASMFRLQGTNFETVNASGAGVSTLIPSMSLDTWYILSTAQAASSQIGYKNGATANTVNYTTDYRAMTLGGRLFSLYGNFFKGDVFAVIAVEGTVLSWADHYKTLQWLSTQTGIALAV